MSAVKHGFSGCARFKTNKWHCYNEIGLINITKYDDTRKVCENGRLMKVLGEFMKYVKETGRS